MNDFDIFKTVLNGPEPDKAHIDKMSSYLFLRWLSGNQNVIHAANLLNRYYNVPEYLQYKMFRNNLHKKLKFIPYPKGNDKRTFKSIEVIQKHYKVNKDIAIEMHDLISETELNYLIDLYK